MTKKMKFNIVSENLFKALILAANAKGDGKINVTSGNVLICASKDRQSVEFTCGTDNRALKTATGENEAKVEESGSVSVREDLLAELLRTIPVGTEVELKSDGRNLVISWPGGSANAPCDIPEAMNLMDTDVKGEVELSLAGKTGDILGAVEAAARCTSRDPIRPVLETVCVSIREDGAEIVGTDNRALVVSSVIARTEGHEDILLPGMTLKILIEMMRAYDAEGEIKISVSESESRKIIVSTEKATFVTSPETGKFPNWKKLLETIPSPAATATVNTKELSSALGRLAVTSDAEGLVKMTVKTDKKNELKALLFEGKDICLKTSGKETVSVSGEGKETFSSYHIPILQRALKNFSAGDSVKIAIGDGQKTPLMISFGDDFADISRKMLLVPFYSK